MGYAISYRDSLTPLRSNGTNEWVERTGTAKQNCESQ